MPKNTKSSLLFLSLFFCFTGAISLSHAGKGPQDDKEKPTIRTTVHTGGTATTGGPGITTGGDFVNHGSININLSQTQTKETPDGGGVQMYVPDTIHVISARYGGTGWLGRGGWQDVLPHTRSNFDGRVSGDVAVTNQHLGGDPCRGITKTLEVYYKCMRLNRESQLLVAKGREGDILHISCNNNQKKKF